MLGRSLGHYEIREPLGSGGMGDVYRAHDTRLNRDVAIKVLPEDLADDPDRLARLKREAHLLAALNHPNVATIHGFEESEGTRFLVMELVKGESLDKRLSSGPLPVEEALDICRQIAEALEAAHDEGIIHRDLKPANVLITPEGRAKVLDFGLAKTVGREPSDTDLSHSPTITIAGTQAGVILGTAPYMSPEQVRGKPLDKRADIWAFGCVLYETLTGSRAFNRETVADTLAAILEVDPPWDALPAATPVITKSLLRRCLHKDPRRRLHDIADARIEIEEAGERGSEFGSAGGSLVAPASGWTARMRIAAVAVVATAMIAGAVAWSRFAVQPPEQPTALQIELPERLLRSSIGGNHIAISPDGRHLVYVAGSDTSRFYLVHRPIDRFEHTPVPGTDDMRAPFFSPDGSRVGFSGGGAIKIAALDGGAPMALCSDCIGGTGWAAATWSPADDTIIFAKADGSLWRVAAEGGEPTLVRRSPPDEGYDQPSFLPDGKALLVRVYGPARRAIGLLELETGELKTLVESGSAPSYARSGHLVYVADTNSLWAVSFDAERYVTQGKPALVQPEVKGFQYAFSEGGLLAFASRGEDTPVRHSLVWVDRKGNPTPLTDRPGVIGTPRLSPEADRIAVDSGGRIWIYELETGTWQMLSSKVGYSQAPVWMPDGRHIVHANGVGPAWIYEVFWVATDFASEPERLFEHAGSVFPFSGSPSGALALVEIRSDGSRNMGVWSRGVSAPSFQRTTSDERVPMVSPNGSWVAFTSDRDGGGEVYVAPFPEGGETIKVSNGGGVEPQWARDGTELYYRNVGQMIAVPVVTSEPEFSFSAREVLFDNASFVLQVFRAGYDVHPDGRFLMVQRDEIETDPQAGLTTHINIITNWFEELKKLVSTGQ